jgi:hypothetical protein
MGVMVRCWSAVPPATTQRVSCPEHGVVVAAVPWARAGSRLAAAFEHTCAWLVCHAALSVVAVLLRVAWRECVRHRVGLGNSMQRLDLRSSCAA